MGFLQCVSFIPLFLYLWVVYIVLQFIALFFIFGAIFCRVKMRRIVFAQLLARPHYQTVVVSAPPPHYEPYGGTQQPYQPYSQQTPGYAQPQPYTPPTNVNLAKEV